MKRKIIEFEAGKTRYDFESDRQFDEYMQKLEREMKSAKVKLTLRELIIIQNQLERTPFKEVEGLGFRRFQELHTLIIRAKGKLTPTT